MGFGPAQGLVKWQSGVEAGSGRPAHSSLPPQVLPRSFLGATQRQGSHRGHRWPSFSSWPSWEDRAWGMWFWPARGWRSGPAWPGFFGVIRCLIAEACRCWACDYDLQPGCPAGVSFGLSSQRFLNEEALQSLPSPQTTEAEIESPSLQGRGCCLGLG